MVTKTTSTTRRRRISIAGYLIDRMYGLGIRHVFGIPGDYVLGFYNRLERSRLRCIGTTREDCAGFAADAYARLRGLGAVCVTYCVGGFNLTNPVAGAYAEKSPVIVISGSPGVSERAKNPLLHHRVRDFSTQREVFDKITCASAVLDDPLTAFREVDRVLAAAQRYKRPVYIELPRDCVDMAPVYEHAPPEKEERSDPTALREALAEAGEMIRASERPVILAGVEVHRFGLQDLLLRLAEGAKIPIAATLLGKSVVSEVHPLFAGIYEGAMGREAVRRFVEESDCLILLGAFMTDIDMGGFTAHLDQGRCIDATAERLRIRYHRYEDVLFADFLRGLTKVRRKGPCRPIPPREAGEGGDFRVRPDAPVTVRRMFRRLNTFLADDMVVIADPGDAMFGAADLTIHRRTEFVSPAYYASMGFAIPAALGAQLANPRLRPLVLVGDGAFQMTGMELSNVLRHGQNPIVLVLNNEGYGTERFLQEGAFNDIHPWQYHRLPEVLGGGKGFEARTEGELEKALRAALANRDSFSLLNVHLSKTDCSPALAQLARRLSKKV
jgi:indolepyruvate decarboxylase